MSIETIDETEKSDRAGRGLREWVSSPWELPRNYPTGWAIAWTLLLLGLCLTPKSMMPDEDSFSFREYIPHSDLAVHFTLFTGFVMSWIRVGGTWLRWMAVPVVGVFLAAATEYAQGLPYIHRDPNLLDALADIVGVLAGLTASRLLYRATTATQVPRSPAS